MAHMVFSATSDHEFSRGCMRKAQLSTLAPGNFGAPRHIPARSGASPIYYGSFYFLFQYPYTTKKKSFMFGKLCRLLPLSTVPN